MTTTTSEIRPGAIVLYRSPFAKRARRYYVEAIRADGRLSLYYSSPAARGGSYVGRNVAADPAACRVVSAEPTDGLGRHFAAKAAS